MNQNHHTLTHTTYLKRLPPIHSQGMYQPPWWKFPQLNSLFSTWTLTLPLFLILSTMALVFPLWSHVFVLHLDLVKSRKRGVDRRNTSLMTTLLWAWDQARSMMLPSLILLILLWRRVQGEEEGLVALLRRSRKLKCLVCFFFFERKVLGMLNLFPFYYLNLNLIDYLILIFILVVNFSGVTGTSFSPHLIIVNHGELCYQTYN